MQIEPYCVLVLVDWRWSILGIVPKDGHLSYRNGELLCDGCNDDRILGNLSKGCY